MMYGGDVFLRRMPRGTEAWGRRQLELLDRVPLRTNAGQRGPSHRKVGVN